MTDPCTPAELAVAIRSVLEEALPSLQAADAHDARVAIRLADVLRREVEQGEEARQAESAGLRALLPGCAELPLEALRARLCREIAEGRIGPGHPQLVAHLWRTTRARLAIDNPRYCWRAL